MAKTFLYRIFGIGKIPASVRAEFESEGIVFYDEGIRGTVTYIKYRAPGRYSNWKRQWFSAAIILTDKRLIALRLRDAVIDVPIKDERFRRLKFSFEGEETQVVAFDASVFDEGATGTIEYRFKTPIARQLCDTLISQQV